MRPFCSTIIPTVGRASLARAVSSVLEQDGDPREAEVVVVNDSGAPLPSASWIGSPRVRVIASDRVERSRARNLGAARARGRFLHFLDDDDVLLPGALAAFRDLHAESPTAAWLHGGYETVDNAGLRVDLFRPALEGDILVPLVAGESIPLQASLIEAAAFREAGGFDPDLNCAEDRDLGRRLARFVQMQAMPVAVASIRVGQVGSTTNWARLAEDDRTGREKVLALQETAARLRANARDAYWRGRICRAYLGSTHWNVVRGHFVRSGQRAIAAARLVDRRAVTPAFWRGVRNRAHHEGQ
jgi:glycosyltransferase involved in cell wall biosynthesis